MLKKALCVGALLSAWTLPCLAKPVEVYAHRGARSFAPENTMPAYKTSLVIGCDWVDMDVVLTKDGEVLISHNCVLSPDIVRDAQGQFVPPGLGARGAAKNLTLAELQKYDVGRLNPNRPYAKYFPDQVPVDGTRMPTLREVVRYVNQTTGNHVGFQIEMKTDPSHPEVSADPVAFAKAINDILVQEDIVDRAEIQAFDFQCLVELHKINPKAKGAYLTSRDSEKRGAEDFEDPKLGTLWTAGKRVKDYGSIPKMVKALGGFAWEPEDYELTKESLAEAHALGLKVVVWSWPEKLGTAFDAPLVAKMIEWGVDGIITDDPGRLISMLAVRGLPVPQRYKVDAAR